MRGIAALVLLAACGSKTGSNPPAPGGFVKALQLSAPVDVPAILVAVQGDTARLAGSWGTSTQDLPLASGHLHVSGLSIVAGREPAWDVTFESVDLDLGDGTPSGTIQATLQPRPTCKCGLCTSPLPITAAGPVTPVSLAGPSVIMPALLGPADRAEVSFSEPLRISTGRLDFGAWNLPIILNRDESALDLPSPSIFGSKGALEVDVERLDGETTHLSASFDMVPAPGDEPDLSMASLRGFAVEGAVPVDGGGAWSGGDFSLSFAMPVPDRAGAELVATVRAVGQVGAGKLGAVARSSRAWVDLPAFTLGPVQHVVRGGVEGDLPVSDPVEVHLPLDSLRGRTDAIGVLTGTAGCGNPPEGLDLLRLELR